MKKISLTGIKPTGTPHLGNYVGAIRPALELTKTYDTVYFIADYHALTTVQNGAEMRANIYKVAATRKNPCSTSRAIFLKSLNLAGLSAASRRRVS